MFALQLIRVQTRFFCCFAERSFMHTRRKGEENNAGQMLVLNGIDHFADLFRNTYTG